MNRQLLLIALILAMPGFAGCEAIPVAQHPLSSEVDSEIDPPLLGLWDIIDEAALRKQREEEAEKDQPEKPDPDERRPPRFGIGRLAGKERSLELVSLQLADDQIEVKRMAMHATKVGEQSLISLRVDPEVDNSDYILLRYKVVNENRILVYLLSSDAIVRAIQRGELKGVVRKAVVKDPNDPNSEQRKQSIRITAPTQELRDFLAKNEKTAFEDKPTWRLQKAEGN